MTTDLQRQRLFAAKADIDRALHVSNPKMFRFLLRQARKRLIEAEHSNDKVAWIGLALVLGTLVVGYVIGRAV